MADVTNSKTEAPLTAAQQRAKAIQAYHDAKTREEKAAVVKEYPELADVFSAVNHN